LTRTRCPARTPACSNSACHAVSPTAGSAAACEWDRGRRRHQHARRGDDVLRRRAVGVQRQEAHDRVADRKAAHAVAERVDRAGDVDARDVRERDVDQVAEEAVAHRRVEEVERRGGDGDPHLAGTRDRSLDVLVAQDARVAVLVESHGLHGEPPFR
jgi:hypothetical protein